MCKADDPAIVNQGHMLLGAVAHVRLLQGGGLAQRLHGLGQTLYHTVLLRLIPSSVQERRPHVGQSYSKLKQLFVKVSPTYEKSLDKDRIKPVTKRTGNQWPKIVSRPYSVVAMLHLHCCGQVTFSLQKNAGLKLTDKAYKYQAQTF